jgi:hypothetical protein
VSLNSKRTMLVLTGFLLSATAVFADDQDPKAIEIIRRAVSAKGNKSSIDKAKAFHCSGKYYMFGSNLEVAPGQVDKWVMPNLFKIESITHFGDRDYKISCGRNLAGEGWGATNDEPSEVSPNRTHFFLNLTQAQEWSNLTTLVDNKNVQLKYLGENKRKLFKSIIRTDEAAKHYTFLGLDSSEVMIGIEIACKDRPGVACAFFFDKNDFLLLSIVHRFQWSKAEPPVEYERQYSNYRVVNGVRFPMTEVSIEDGRAINKSEYEKIILETGFDKSVFEPRKAMP